MMNNLILLLYPVANVMVTGLFAGVVLRQYMQRHRLYQLYWAIALMMAFVATLAYVGMIIAQPISDVGVLLFRLYYILGGALTAAWLGLGSTALVTSKRVTRICLAVLCVLSALAVVLISIAGIDRHQLGLISGTPGTSILQPTGGAWLYTIIVLNTLGSVAVAGVAVYSGWKLKRRQGTSGLLWANVLILAGAVTIALAGTTARLGIKNIFWLIMALGWTVFFIGVLMASRPRSHAAPEKKEGQDQSGISTKKHNRVSV
jgi:hypothetical protein